MFPRPGEDRARIAFNRGDGLSLRCARRNAITGVEIVDDQGYGLFASGICTGTVVRGATIARNLAGNVNLARSRGVIVIPGA